MNATSSAPAPADMSKMAFFTIVLPSAGPTSTARRRFSCGVVLLRRLTDAGDVDGGGQLPPELLIETGRVHDDAFGPHPVVVLAHPDVGGRGPCGHLRVESLTRFGAEHLE